MTVKTSRAFETEAEALAFVEGLQFVNDSALSWTEPYQQRAEGPERRIINRRILDVGVRPDGGTIRRLLVERRKQSTPWWVDIEDTDGEDDGQVVAESAR